MKLATRLSQMASRRSRAILGAGAAGLAILTAWWFTDTPLPAGAIARIDGVVLDRSDLEAYLGEAAEFETVGVARLAVDRWVGSRLLELAAEDRGELPDGLLERLVVERGGVERVTDEEVRARYERDLHLYQRPRQVWIAYAGIPLSADDSASETHEALRELADQIHVRGRLHPAREELALWIPRGDGRAYARESGPWSCDGPADQTAAESSAPPRELVLAACELREGRLTRVVETHEGFFIAKVRRRTRAWNVPYARVAARLREDLELERLEQARRAESERLRRRASVRISPEAVAALVVSTEPGPVTGVSAHPPSPPGFSEDS